jgi:hypothetical protein
MADTNNPKKFQALLLAKSQQKKPAQNKYLSVVNTRSQDYPPTKTTGIKMRGTGAATKGLMSRGPMA